MTIMIKIAPVEPKRVYSVCPSIEEGMEFHTLGPWKSIENFFYIGAAVVRSVEESQNSAFSRSVVMDLIGRSKILAKTK